LGDDCPAGRSERANALRYWPVRKESVPEMTREFSFLPAVEATALCKVCAKKIGPSEERVRIWHHGSEYIVCCATCAEKFRSEPQLHIVT
jgi:YHS domain-containing protein